MFDEQLAHLEVEHFHQLLEIFVTGFQQLLSLLIKQLYVVVLAGVEVDCQDVKLSLGHRELNDALDVMRTDHTQVLPHYRTVLRNLDRTGSI